MYDNTFVEAYRCEYTTLKPCMFLYILCPVVQSLGITLDGSFSEWDEVYLRPDLNLDHYVPLRMACKHVS